MNHFLSSYKQKYVHGLLVNCSVKLAQEKCVFKWTDRLDLTIAVDWDIKSQTKQTKRQKTHEKIT